MVPLSSIAADITATPHGYWRAPAAGAMSYPDEAHERCDAISEASFWYSHRNRVIAAAVRRFPPADGLIADIGGGNGYVAMALQNAGFQSVVIEPSESAAHNAVRRGVAHVICGSAESAGLKPSSVGAVGLFDVLEHVRDDEAFLRFVRTRLKEAGRLYATVPAFQWLWSNADVESGHFRRYTRQDLVGLARRAGFEVEYCTCFFWCLPPAAWLLRVAPSKRAAPRKRSSAVVKAEHGVAWPRLAALIRGTLAPELQLIQRARTIPFGTSCLLIARR